MKTKSTKKTASAKTKKSTAKAKTKAKPKAVKKKAAPKAKATRKKKAELTHILAIIDKSGSMNTVRKDAIGGFNTFLTAQKKQKDPATMNVVLFSSHDEITPLYDGKIVDVKDVQELTEATYVPNGSTALHDAMVKSMTDLKLKVNEMKPSKRPAKILVLIITDGEENASREYPKSKIDEVKKLVQLRKDENWQFIFMCSTEDTALTGEALGFSKGNVFQYTNDSLGNEKMFFAASNAASLFRSTSLQDKAYVTISNNLISDEAIVEKKKSKTVDVDSDND